MVGIFDFRFAVRRTGCAQVAKADTAEANCEVARTARNRVKVRAVHVRSAPGHIDIDLRNGDTYSFEPGNNANHYATRRAQGRAHEFDR